MHWTTLTFCMTGILQVISLSLSLPPSLPSDIYHANMHCTSIVHCRILLLHFLFQRRVSQMNILLTAVLNELTTRSINFLIENSFKPTAPDMEDRLRRILLRAQVIIDEAMDGRSQTEVFSSSWTNSETPCTTAITSSTPSYTNLKAKRRPKVRS